MKQQSFSFPDGRRLIWYEAGHGPPLVLLHGWSISAAAFLELAHLLSADFRLLMPDLPGHGRSMPSPQQTLPGLAAELGCWLSAVAPGAVSLGGWSLGGMLALELSLQHPLTIKRLALMSTTPRFTSGQGWSSGLPASQVKALARNLERRFEATLADFFALAFAGEIIPAERQRIIRAFAVKRSPVPDKAVALQWLEILANQDQRELLSKITQNTLVLHGELDQIAPVSAGKALADMLPSGHFLGLAGVGHAPFLSRPEEVASVLREFC